MLVMCKRYVAGDRFGGGDVVVVDEVFGDVSEGGACYCCAVDDGAWRIDGYEDEDFGVVGGEEADE